MDDQDTGGTEGSTMHALGHSDLGQGVGTSALKVIWKIQILNIKF